MEESEERRERQSLQRQVSRLLVRLVVLAAFAGVLSGIMLAAATFLVWPSVLTPLGYALP